MRRLIALTAIALSALGLAVAVNPSGAGAARRVTHTVKTVVRPVTAGGHVAAGFTLHNQPNHSVNCSAQSPSPGAVSPNIEVCKPLSEYAIACWKSAVAHRALCMRNAKSKDVYQIPRTGAFAPTPIAPAAYRAPLLIKLGDGDYCAIGVGTAVGTLTTHPSLYGTYGCLRAGYVWSPVTGKHFGVNESNPLWKVRTAPSGNHQLVTKIVVQAWFVGTRTG